MLTIPFISGADPSALIARGAHINIASVNWPHAQLSNPASECFAAHDGLKLKLLFRVRQNTVLATYTANQSPVSQDSCVEAFFQPENSRQYWNFEFNCIGAVNGSHRETRPNPTRLTDSEIATISRIPSLGTEPFGELEQTEAWSLLVEIPLSIMAIQADSPVRIRANFYSCSSKASRPYYLSWNPIPTDKPDFHRPEYFGEIVLAAKSE